MRSFITSLIALAAFARAQSVIGTYYSPIDDSETSVAPDVSVLGLATVDSGNGDVSVVGLHTIDASSTAADDANPTQTQCYQLVTAETVTARVAAQPTIVDGHSPQGIQCWVVYWKDGGIISSPLPQQTAAADSSQQKTTNKSITLVLPIVLSIVGVILISGGILTFFHLRNKKRRAEGGASGEKRAWVNRKNGWAKMADEETGVVRPEVAQVAQH